MNVKHALFSLLGKDPEGVIVSFWTGDEEQVLRMVAEVRRLVPDRRHYVVTTGAWREIPGAQCVTLDVAPAGELYLRLRRAFRPLRIAQAPVLFTPDSTHDDLRCAAFLLAPRKILAYNGRLERHHPRLRSAIASLLFLRGVPLDRIFLRPRWLWPWKEDRSVVPTTWRILDGRPLDRARRRVGVLSPYFPYPLSHGGAVRLFNLLREAAHEFDVFLFAFVENEQHEDFRPVLEFCAKAVLVDKPRYREPRWASVAPPEVLEYASPTMRRLLAEVRKSQSLELLQVEYTQLVPYGGDILVEHDVTFDLHQQVCHRAPTLGARWDLWRWLRFERRAVARHRRVVAMSEKDAVLLGGDNVRVIPNGVDLDRFRPEPERPGQRLLFIGSFRHFPNVVAYRFFVERIWPRLRDRFPEMTLTVVTGADPLIYWRAYADTPEPPRDDRVRLLEFVADVRPLYVEANIVLVPTLVSAGTNVKALEAMAMERAVVSTSSGCAGLGLRHDESVWIGDDEESFGEGVAQLAADQDLRARLARAARHLAEERYDWRRLGELQGKLWRELLPS